MRIFFYNAVKSIDHKNQFGRIPTLNAVKALIIGIAGQIDLVLFFEFPLHLVQLFLGRGISGMIIKALFIPCKEL